MRKWLIVLLSVLVLSGLASKVSADDLGAGTGTGYPATVDTNPTPETGADSTAFEPGEGVIAAVIAVQTELGTDPAGSKSTVKAYLLTEHAAAGTHTDITGDSIDVTTTKIGGVTVSATGTEINTVCDGVLSGSGTWDPGSIANGAEEAKDVTVTGAVLGDYAIGSFSLDVTDLVLNCQITASDTATCVLANNTGGAIDLGSGTVKVMLITQ